MGTILKGESGDDDDGGGEVVVDIKCSLTWIDCYREIEQPGVFRGGQAARQAPRMHNLCTPPGSSLFEPFVGKGAIQRASASGCRCFVRAGTWAKGIVSSLVQEQGPTNKHCSAMVSLWCR